MTTEEAIKHLWYDWYILGDGRLAVDSAEEFQEAIGLAIAALRAQAAIVHCKDCKHLYFKDFEAYCRYRALPCRPRGFCERGERSECSNGKAD